MQIRYLILEIWISLFLALLPQSCNNKPIATIYISNEAEQLEKLAAYEVRKYIYLRTGEILPIIKWEVQNPIVGDAFVIGTLCQKMIIKGHELPILNPNSFIIKSFSINNGKKILITGDNQLTTLYSAYYFAEQLGIGFDLNGDIIPDEKIPFQIPNLNVKKTELFNIRGILPFHDFPEGPDWWSVDDYKAIIAQLPKLRMNFIGFNTYPEGEVGPEPMVWIGPSWNINGNQMVKFSYNASHFTTFDGDPYKWGYEPMNTSEYYFGASQLFEKDNFGAEYMMELGHSPLSFNEQNILFNKFGHLLSDAFSFANVLGVKTCVGTQTPLRIPERLEIQLKSIGKNPNDPDVIKEIYEGIFKRINITHPLDYYWLWTSENWLQGVSQSMVNETVSDLKTAISAANNSKVHFDLATSGWVLGPEKNRTLFDSILPENMPMGSLNQRVGFLPIEPMFKKIENRPKWAITWLEDDAAMVTPQLWVGRILRDAADALLFDCSGLIGIHWRTRIIGPNISALANAVWSENELNLEDSLYSFNCIKSKQASYMPYISGIKSRDLPSKDFYHHWAKISFGDEKADEIAEIFSRLDGGDLDLNISYKSNLPRPSTWVNGPGGITPDNRPWAKVQKDYQFVNELEELRTYMNGASNLERYDYWLNQFRYLREIGHLNCIWFQFNEVMGKIVNTNNPLKQQLLAAKEALPLRIEMIDILTELQNYLLTSITTYGGLGNVTNWQQHILPDLIREPGILLEKYLMQELPEDAKLPITYSGSTHMFVNKVRTTLQIGENINLKIRTISSDNEKPIKAVIKWKSMGKKRFNTQDIKHLARGVYEANINHKHITEEGLEYYILVKFGNGEIKRFPASAPNINQTVILLPE